MRYRIFLAIPPPVRLSPPLKCLGLLVLFRIFCIFQNLGTEGLTDRYRYQKKGDRPFVRSATTDLGAFCKQNPIPCKHGPKSFFFSRPPPLACRHMEGGESNGASEAFNLIPSRSGNEERGGEGGL